MDLAIKWPTIRKDLINSENENKVYEILSEIDTDLVNEYTLKANEEASIKLRAIGEQIIANKYT